MGLDAQRALGAVALSLGYDTTAADVDTAATALSRQLVHGAGLTMTIRKD